MNDQETSEVVAAQKKNGKESQGNDRGRARGSYVSADDPAAYAAVC